MSKITIDTTAPERALTIYWGASRPIPPGSTPVGYVRRSPGDDGLLLRMSTGIYVQGNAGSLRSLPQADVAAAVSAAILGARGRGASKRRAIDYAALARKSHAARRKNSADADSINPGCDACADCNGKDCARPGGN
jgi:hypothetical protein